MIKDLDLENQLVKYNQNDRPNVFVSIAVQLDEDGEAKHAVIFIRYRGSDYLFHFPGAIPPVIENYSGQLTPNLIYKVLDNFDTEDDSDVGSFLRHCQRVCDQSNVTYGFIFDNSTYETDGRYLSISGLPEIATCVGFCVNVLSNYVIDIDKSYFQLDDWDTNGIIENYDVWAQQQTAKNYPDLDWNLYNTYKKRISPIEYLSSGFCSVFPIRKQTIQNIQPHVEREIAIKLA
ncbi:hypothetical protein [Chryseobacterium balustinum]|uniref:Uncharacterized protein n=1 Tax=Chryseobacterium balustinum TaxID=246 RepID=A0AAX2ING4_9FLAO|nr:hypothetical protein [Chryseobacterium balustinum]AZB29183.1 hypothetical protein EB354_07920 [Chryseobacterium balustinum]SKB69120.1 hypothetical protein SAMN05421800_10671 [Chryseobacterium balustinum]SQA91551.1 Uncharacterised protein [Chryseobacterium balustinum]